MEYTAILAEDEPLLAAAMQRELASLWPDLRVVADVRDGRSAVACALEHVPDVMFLDIRMPGLSGLDAALELAEAWPASAPYPLLVFVTAYDQYAVQAFEAQAVDYVVKPVDRARLAKTIERLKGMLVRRRGQPPGDLESSFDALRRLVGSQPGAQAAPPPLQLIQASVGNQIQMVPVDQVLYFEAADKYVRVLTAGHEYLIRTPLKELMPRLPSDRFWQIHRGTVVQAAAIEAVTRDEAGKLSLSVRGRPEKLVVSRLYHQLFRAM